MADNDEEEIQEAEPVAEPKSSVRNWIRYVIVAVVLVVGGVWGAKEVQQRFTHVYEYDARIAGSLITVSSRVAGWVTKINVAEGDEVAKGQVVFAIDSRNSELFVDQLVAQIQGVDAERQRLRAEKDLVDKKTAGRYRTQKSELSAAQAAVKSLEPQLALARSEQKRVKSLYQKKIVSRKSRDQALARMQQLAGEYETATAEVQSARDKLLEAEADRIQLNVLDGEIAKLSHGEGVLRSRLAQQKMDLADRSIRGPVNGVIDKVFVDTGEYVSPGQRLALTHDPHSIWIEANVKETEIRKLKIGQVVDVGVDAYPDQIFSGRVITIGNTTTAEFALLPSPNPSGNFTKITQRLPVRIAIDQKERLLRPGMMVEVNIDIR
ncbi:HlyD family secretion protein [Alphaproteobacteria bacterium]|nr:HlyD family secretion protein [Alphaproteobacteria bacterium]